METATTDAVMHEADTDAQKEGELGEKEDEEPQQECADADEWHTTGSKYLQKRIARGVFDDDDVLIRMEFGTVVGWLPVEVADFISEHTDKPAALWHIKFDKEELGEEDLEEFEVKRALKEYTETLREQRGEEKKEGRKRARTSWSKIDDNFEEADDDEEFQAEEDAKPAGGSSGSKPSRRRVSSQSRPRTAVRDSEEEISATVDDEDMEVDNVGGAEGGGARWPLVATGREGEGGVEELGLEVQMLKAEVERRRAVAEEAERGRREAEERLAVLGAGLQAEIERTKEVRAEGGEGAAVDAGQEAEREKVRKEAEERVRAAAKALEERVEREREAEEAREEAKEEVRREGRRARQRAAEEVERVRREGEDALRRERRERESEVARGRRRAEAEAECKVREGLRGAAERVMGELAGLVLLARASVEGGKRAGRALEEATRVGRVAVGLWGGQEGAVEELRRFVGRYGLVLSRPPLPALMTLCQLATQEGAGSRLAREGEAVVRERTKERARGGADRRGWEEVKEEWLVRRVGGGGETGEACTRVMGVHVGGVQAVAVSEDGRTVVSGGRDGSVRVWDAATGQGRGGARRGGGGLVTCVAVSADGVVVVSGGADRMVRVWHGGVGEGVGERELRGHMGEVTAVQVLRGRGGLRVVSGSLDETLRVWAVQSGEEQGGAARRHAEGVTCLAGGPGEGEFVSGGKDGMVRVWAGQGTFSRWKQPQVDHGRAVAAVAVCGDAGGEVVSVDVEGRVLVWSLPLAQLLFDAPPARHRPAAVAALPGYAGVVVTGGLDRAVRVWHAESWEEEREAAWGHTEEVTAVACGPRGVVVTGSADACVRVWEAGLLRRQQRVTAETGEEEREAEEGGAEEAGGGGQPPGTGEGVGGGAGREEGHEGGVTCVAVSADGRVAASGGRDGVVRVWGTESGESVARLGGHRKRVTAVGLSGDGRRVASGGADKTVRVWDWEGELWCVEAHKGAVQSVALSACGGEVLSGGKDAKESVRVWSVEGRGQLQGPVDGNSGGAAAVWYSEDGRVVGARSAAGAVTRWERDGWGRVAEGEKAEETGAESKGKGKAEREEEVESAWGRFRVVVEEELVLVMERKRGGVEGPASRAVAGEGGGLKGGGEAGGGRGGGKEVGAVRERCVGMYRVRGAVRAVQAGRGGVVCVGCESGEVLILRAAAMAAEAEGAAEGEGAQ